MITTVTNTYPSAAFGGRYLRTRQSCSSSPSIVPRRAMARIPNEILSYIFLQATHSGSDYDPGLPLTLSQICSRWRHVSLGTGSLWTKITLTYPTSRSQMSSALTWLSRSNVYPLDILLDFRDPSWDWGDPSWVDFDEYEEEGHGFRWQDMEAVMRILLPHVSRWRTFELLTDTWAPIFTFLWYTRRAKEAPMLEALRVSRCNAYFAAKGQEFQPERLKIPLALFGGKRLDKLREVSLVGVHVDWEKSLPAFSSGKLESLELKYHAREVLPTMSEFIDIVSSCPGLRRLSIVGWGPKADVDAVKEGIERRRITALSGVMRLHLGCVDVDYTIQLLSCLCFPALEEFVLEDISRSLYPIQPQDTTRLLQWLSCQRDDEGPTLATVRVLELHGIRAEIEALSGLLFSMPSVQHLTLLGLDPSMLAALLPPGRSHNESVPCPRLTELRCHRMPVNDIGKVVLSRGQLGYLKKVELDSTLTPAVVESLRALDVDLAVEEPEEEESGDDET